jgi:hypothetical protein
MTVFATSTAPWPPMEILVGQGFFRCSALDDLLRVPRIKYSCDLRVATELGRDKD